MTMMYHSETRLGQHWKPLICKIWTTTRPPASVHSLRMSTIQRYPCQINYQDYSIKFCNTSQNLNDSRHKLQTGTEKTIEISCMAVRDIVIIINGLILPLYPVLCCFKRDLYSVSTKQWFLRYQRVTIIIAVFYLIFSNDRYSKQ